jgi:hypothetical protein
MSTPARTLQDELDARQDELLAQLDDLNQRLELLLTSLKDGPVPTMVGGEAYAATSER